MTAYTAKITAAHRPCDADGDTIEDAAPVGCDARIFADGTDIGGVTLFVDDYSGKLTAHGGSLDSWADRFVMEHLTSIADRDDRREAMDEIEAAVQLVRERDLDW